MVPAWMPTLLLFCAPQVHAGTALALVHTESSFNPWAIGVVGGTLMRQPRHGAEAIATAHWLQAAGWNFSVGLAQINVHNWDRLGLTLTSVFEPCRNLAAMQTLLHECFQRAARAAKASSPAAAIQPALQRALSCYYSGNFTTGFQHGYVHRLRSAVVAPAALPFPLKEQP